MRESYEKNKHEFVDKIFNLANKISGVQGASDKDNEEPKITQEHLEIIEFLQKLNVYQANQMQA